MFVHTLFGGLSNFIVLIAFESSAIRLSSMSPGFSTG
jgi:hypothetical protein